MLWQYWAEEWALYERVSFNGDTRTIVVHEGASIVDIRTHVYSAWVRWRSRGNDHYTEAFRRTGFDPIPGGVTGDTYFLINDWKLSLDLREVKVTGVLFSDDYDTAYWDKETGLALYPAQVSSVVNTIFAGGGSGGSSAADVWSYPTRTITDQPEYNGPTKEEIATEIWTTPLTITLPPGSFGHYIAKKILTVSKFIGLK